MNVSAHHGLLVVDNTHLLGATSNSSHHMNSNVGGGIRGASPSLLEGRLLPGGGGLWETTEGGLAARLRAVSVPPSSVLSLPGDSFDKKEAADSGGEDV